MTNLIVHLPERTIDRVSEGLCLLTERIDAIDPELVAHGFLGGQHGYGADFENDVFKMRPYCWCDAPNCPWCGGCDCDTVPTVDGKDVTYDEWIAFYDQERAKGIDPDAINERRDHRLRGPRCDFCTGKGVFATNGSEPGMGAPNFWHKPSGFKVWWYKYIGRDMKFVGMPRAGTIDECIASLASAGEAAKAAETQGGSVHEHATA